jgi:hypothetical protein
MTASTTGARLEAALRSIGFPAERDALVAAAERYDDDRTTRALGCIPAGEYAGISDVFASVSIVEVASAPADDDAAPGSR